MPEFKTTNALVLSAHRISEHTFILSLLTQENGRWRSAINAKIPPESGSFVHARWQARLSEQTGRFYIEQTDSFWTRFMFDKKRLSALMSLCYLSDKLLPERQPCPDFYNKTTDFLTHLDQDDFLARYVQLEVNLLHATGFGLDTSSCAGGGDLNNLAYISPKSGRAVSLEKGKPYHDKLLPLPPFLWRKASVTPSDIRTGLNLTGYFLTTHAGLDTLPAVRDILCD